MLIPEQFFIYYTISASAGKHLLFKILISPAKSLLTYVRNRI